MTLDCTTSGYSRSKRHTNTLVVIPRAVSLQNSAALASFLTVLLFVGVCYLESADFVDFLWPVVYAYAFRLESGNI